VAVQAFLGFASVSVVAAGGVSTVFLERLDGSAFGENVLRAKITVSDSAVFLVSLSDGAGFLCSVYDEVI
jgi:hypothetical protein